MSACVCGRTGTPERPPPGTGSARGPSSSSSSSSSSEEPSERAPARMKGALVRSGRLRLRLRLPRQERRPRAAPRWLGAFFNQGRAGRQAGRAYYYYFPADPETEPSLVVLRFLIEHGSSATQTNRPTMRMEIRCS
eukprot:scaffold20_cov361-Prasinococcus_capsulatus_cf.AAC.15